MNQNIPIENILFIDIETVPQYSSFDELPEETKSFWKHKAEQINKDEFPEKLYEQAGIYAEFGKIVCIGLGYVSKKTNNLHVRIKSLHGHDERQILTEFFAILKKHFNTEQHYLCAHNGKEFDYPYIVRRAIINRIPVPSILQTAGYKPWEIRHLDTMELWRFGDRKNFTSLNLLAHIFQIPSPKNEMSGKDVYRVYYIEQDLEKIADYCKKDVLTLIKVYMRYCSLDEETITYEFV